MINRLHGNEDKSGVYVIFNIKNGRFYIGQTINFARRYTEHSNSLQKGIHWNTFMQKDYNKCGKNVYEFCIVETCEKSKLDEREQYWLDEYYKTKGCYNLVGKVRPDRKYLKVLQKQALKKIIKKFTLISPDNKVIEGKNLTEFSKKHDLNFKNLSALVLGEQKSHKGWRTVENKNYNFTEKKTYNIKLTSPDGKIYGPITGLLEFARKHNLSKENLSSLVNGKIKTYKGWSLLDGKSKRPQSKTKNHTFVSPTGIVYSDIKNISEFAQQHNLNPASMSKLISGKRTSLFGWKYSMNKEELKNG